MHQALFQRHKETLDILLWCGMHCKRLRRGRLRFGTQCAMRKGGHTQLIGHHLHCGCQIERTVARIRRDMHQPIAGQDVLVRQPEGFIAEHQRHRCKRRRRSRHGRHRLARSLARQHRLLGDLAFARSECELQLRVANGRMQAGHALGAAQQIECAGRHGTRLGVIGRRVTDDDQARQSHVLERARRSTNISRMTGMHQHDSHLRQRQGCKIVGSIHRVGHRF